MVKTTKLTLAPVCLSNDGSQFSPPVMVSIKMYGAYKWEEEHDFRESDPIVWTLYCGDRMYLKCLSRAVV